MIGKRAIWAVVMLLAVILAVPVQQAAGEPAKASSKQLIFDEAGLLNETEIRELSALANKYGAQRETDILIFTTTNPDNTDVVVMTQDFYDTHAPGYDKPHGNAVILTMDMRNREVYLAGFYKAETYLDNDRLSRIRSKMTADLSDGNYERAFRKYIETSYRYMGFDPEVNPDNMLYNGLFQLSFSLTLAGLIVGMMVYRSGGRITVDRRTYEDASQSGVLARKDQYLRTTTSKTKIEKRSGGGGGGFGGGGGRTGGGHSHSGSRGSF